MRKTTLMAIMICLFLVTPLFAANLTLPPELGATAQILKTERDGLWEKSLVVQLPERRHLLSTSDGIINGLGAINHAAAPQLWKKLAQDLATECSAVARPTNSSAKG